MIGRESSNQVAAANLDEAEVIISGGRGVGGVEGFALLEALAKRLGGCVGASRAAVDVGWVSKNLQVGQTGTTVAPELYLAVGISGAIQHQSGMVGAKHIIAINTDDEAAIFGIAHLGVVHDYREILPLLLAAFSD